MRRKKIIPPVVKNRWGAWNKWRCTNCRNVLPAGSEVWEANTSDIKAEYGDYLCKDCAKKILEEKGGAQ